MPTTAEQMIAFALALGLAWGVKAMACDLGTSWSRLAGASFGRRIVGTLFW